MRCFWAIVLSITFLYVKAEVSIISWNLCELGGSKSPEELRIIARIIHEYDLAVIQEVVAKDPKGAQTVAELVGILNRMGSQWDYTVSDPTQSPSSFISERYAFIWKPSKIKLMREPRLLDELSQEVYREPYYAMFHAGEKNIHVLNFHSRRYDQNPEIEVELIINYVLDRHDRIWVIAGDFNMNEEHFAFNNLYRYHYKPAITKQPTTLKMKCSSERYLNHAIDNIYYSPSFLCVESGVIDFVKSCEYLEDSRKISDHLPVYAIIQ